MTQRQIVLCLQALRAEMVLITQSKPESDYRTPDVSILLCLQGKKAVAKDVIKYINEMLRDLIDKNED